MKLNPEGLRAYVRRRWAIVDARDLHARAAQPVDAKMRIAIELYEAARATVPGWPRDEDRRADLEHHIAVRQVLRRLPDARPR